MRRARMALAVFLFASCSGRHTSNGPSVPDAGLPVKPASPGLSQDSYMSLFEEGQAAYYLEHQDTVWLVARLAEGNEQGALTKLALHLLGRIAENFDFTTDPRTELVIIVYMGLIEQEINYGIKVSIDDLSRLQRNEVAMPDLLNMLTEVVNIDLTAIKPYITG